MAQRSALLARLWKQHGHVINCVDISLERATELGSPSLGRATEPERGRVRRYVRRDLEVLGRLPWNDHSEDVQRHVEFFVQQALPFQLRSPSRMRSRAR